jgi:hypothetical protein
MTEKELLLLLLLLRRRLKIGFVLIGAQEKKLLDSLLKVKNEIKSSSKI